MRTSLMICCAVGLVAWAVVVEARYYKKINNDYIAYVADAVDWDRDKRQLHPDATVARVPAVPFVDATANEALPSEVSASGPDLLPAPAEYLTPPAPDSPPPQSQQQAPSARQSQAQAPPLQQPPQQLGTKWDLGFDAGDVLVAPPPDDQQAARYDTLKLFTLLPTSSQPQGDLLESFGPAELETAADSRTPFVDSYHPNWQPQNEPIEEPTNEKVYSFVKTDPHGHFKWGVHIDQ